MDPLGDEVKRELHSLGPQAEIGAVADAWPAAVGAEIARNAWPSRFSRDGTLFVNTRDAVWAFELTQRAAEIAARLPNTPVAEVRAGTARRGRRRAAAGGACAACRGNAGAGARGRSVGVRDRGRRAPRARRESGPREPRERRGRPPVLIHFVAPANAAFAGLFSWPRRPIPQRTSPFWRGSSPSAFGRACTSARPVSGASTTSSTRRSTTRSTRPSQGRNDRIEVTLHPDHSITVQDWGSGIPVDVMKDQGLPALTVVLTKLHAGGKFGGEGYKVSGGLHGVGISVVNALSERFVAEVRRDGKVHRQEFSRGEPLGADGGGRADGGRAQRHAHQLPAGLRDLRGARRRCGHGHAAPARDGLPHARPDDQADRRARRGQDGRVPLRGRDPRLRRAHQPVRRTRSTSGSSTSRARATRAPSRWRCSGTTLTRSPSSRSPTTSTPSKAARISPASAARSRARSTARRPISSS